MFGLNKSATYSKKLAQFLLCRKTETIVPWCRLGWLWLSNTTAEPFGRKQRAMLNGWWTNTPAHVRLSAAQICHVACTVKRIDVGLLLFQACKNSRHVPRGVRGGGGCVNEPPFSAVRVHVNVYTLAVSVVLLHTDPCRVSPPFQEVAYGPEQNYVSLASRLRRHLCGQQSSSKEYRHPQLTR